MSDWWWWPGGEPRGARPVLFFPSAGGDQTAAGPLIGHLAGQRFGVLRMPGRGIREDEPDPVDAQDLVGRIADAVDATGGLPPVLVGHSFGGLLAYAVACELECRGRALGRLIAVTSTAPAVWERDLEQSGARRSGGDAAGFVRRRTERLARSGGIPHDVASDVDLHDRFRRLLRVDIALSVQSVPRVPVHCPITSIVARDDTVVLSEASSGWSEATAVSFVSIVVPGDHFFFRRSPAVLAAHICSEVNALDGVYGF